MSSANHISDKIAIPLIGTLIVHVLILWFFNLTLLTTPPEENSAEILINFEFPEENPVPETSTPETDKGYEKATSNQAKNIASDFEERKIQPADFEKKAKAELQKEINQLIEETREKTTADKLQETENVDEETSIEEENIKEKYNDVLPTEEKPSEYKGKTNILYHLENRYDLKLKVPVYMCEKSGKVVVNIIVNRNGQVVTATINEEKSSVKDYCLYEAAKKAARQTLFNTKYDAPSMQKGYIEYHFMPQ